MAAVDAFTKDVNATEDTRNSSNERSYDNTKSPNDGASYLAVQPSDVDNNAQPSVNHQEAQNDNNNPTFTSTETIRQIGAELQRHLNEEAERSAEIRTANAAQEERRDNYLSGAENDDNNWRTNRNDKRGQEERPNYLSGYDARESEQRSLPDRALNNNRNDQRSNDSAGQTTESAANDKINTGGLSRDTSSRSLLHRISDSIRRDAATGANGLVDIRDDVHEARSADDSSSQNTDIGTKLRQQSTSSSPSRVEAPLTRTSSLGDGKGSSFDHKFTESASLAATVDDEDADADRPRGIAASLGERISSFFTRSPSKDLDRNTTENTQSNNNNNNNNLLSNNDNNEFLSENRSVEELVIVEHAKPGEVVVQETIVTRNEANGEENIETGIVLATPDALPLSEDDVKKTITDHQHHQQQQQDRSTTNTAPASPATPSTASSDTEAANTPLTDPNDRTRITPDPVGDHLLFVAG